MVYRLRPDLKKIISISFIRVWMDGDNKTHRPIHHSLEQHTPFLLQTRTRVHRIRHRRYD